MHEWHDIRFLTPLQQMACSKYGDKRRNCSKRAISPFVTMFSTLFNFGYALKVVCCRIVVCGKGLITCFNHSHIYRCILKPLIFITMFSALYSIMILFRVKSFSISLPWCFQSHLLQMCCMWEGGKADNVQLALKDWATSALFTYENSAVNTENTVHVSRLYTWRWLIMI